MSRLAKAIKNPRSLLQMLLGAYVWLSFVKLPVTSLRDSAPQSWEAVLAFAAAHHLQWGKDIVFTFGPLGFLTSDFYWGFLLLPTVIWAFFFATVVTVALLPFSQRLPVAVRIPFYIALPLLTVPTSQNLGFDAVYLFSICVIGLSSLPDEKPQSTWFMLAGLTLGVMTAIKFSFSVYCVFTMTVVVCANWFASRSKKSLLLIFTWMITLVFTWLFLGQKFLNLSSFVRGSLQMVSGYSSAMTLMPDRRDLIFGLLLAVSLMMLLTVCWFFQPGWKSRVDRVLIVAAGIFLAWKEGFVRADIHVVVFFVFGFLMAATLPSFLSVEWDDVVNKNPPSVTTLPALRTYKIQSLRLLISAVALLLALSPFVLYKKSFNRAVQTGFMPRITETFTAIFTPIAYKRELEHQLGIMRRWTPLPKIRAAVANGRVGVLNADQDVAILNGLNYVPHPAFQSYSAYTPALQRLNADFYNSADAPEFIIWQPGSVDKRYPTMDDGEVFLKILSGYSPLLREKRFVLWKRDVSSSNDYSLTEERSIRSSMGEWIDVPEKPTWLRVEIRETAAGAIQNLFWSISEVQIDVRFASGEEKSFRLPPGMSRFGFALNPMLDLSPTRFPESIDFMKIASVRIRAASRYAFHDSIRASLSVIQGVPMLESAFDGKNNVSSHEDRK